MITWLWFASIILGGVFMLLGWRKSCLKAVDPYERARDLLVDYAEQCAKELIRK
jgi:hypothetical protein